MLTKLLLEKPIRKFMAFLIVDKGWMYATNGMQIMRKKVNMKDGLYDKNLKFKHDINEDGYGVVYMDWIFEGYTTSLTNIMMCDSSTHLMKLDIDNETNKPLLIQRDYITNFTNNDKLHIGYKSTTMPVKIDIHNHIEYLAMLRRGQ